MAENIFFDLTSEFNAHGPTAVLASGQAVVFYRLALMSKDGDWIVQETREACDRVLSVLERHGARYRAGAPLDPRWLAGGWSSHFEFFDPHGRRIRCDFFSRPPRVRWEFVDGLFRASGFGESLPVVDVVSLIEMKQTQRGKDYPVIAELARLLPEEEEIEWTTDVDRILELAESRGQGSDRPSVVAARGKLGRLAVVHALAAEIDQMQQADRLRVGRYSRASRRFLQAVTRMSVEELALPEGQERMVALAEELLPTRVSSIGDSEHADAE